MLSRIKSCVLLAVMLAILATATSCGHSRSAGGAGSSQAPSTSGGRAEASAPSSDGNEAATPVYNNSVLGLSVVFPTDWAGKYTVKEADNGFYVYFKPRQPADEGAGLFFCVLKKSSVSDVNEYDSIDGKKEINVGGTAYFIGAPLDVDFPDSHPEFSTYQALSEEIPAIIAGIKAA